MKLSKKMLSLAMVLMLLVMCVGSAIASEEKITLRFSWWGSDARHEATLAACEKYHELNPNITIEGEYSAIDTYYQKLITQLSGGTAPDIIQIDYPWLTDFAAQGQFLENFKDYADIAAIDKFDPNYLAGWCSVGDRLEGLPFSLNGYTMMYNQKLVEETGIDLKPDSLWTWDKFVAEGEKFKAAYPDYIFLHSDSHTLEKNVFKPYLIQTYGGQYINDDLTLPFGKENLVQAYDFLLGLLDKGLIQPLSETAAYDGKIDQNPIWANGQGAICIRWTSDLKQLSNDNVVMSSARLPVLEGATDTAINTKPAMIATVYSGSKHKEEAVKFISWILTDKEALDIVTDVRGVPAAAESRDYLASVEKLNPALVQAVQVASDNAGTAQNGYNDNAELTSISVDIMSKVLYKEITSDQAADEFLQRIGEKLEEMKAN